MAVTMKTRVSRKVPLHLEASEDHPVCQKCSLFSSCLSPFMEGMWFHPETKKLMHGLPKDSYTPKGGWVVWVGEQIDSDADESNDLWNSRAMNQVYESLIEIKEPFRIFYQPALKCHTTTKLGKPDINRCFKNHIAPVIKKLNPVAIIASGPVACAATVKRLDAKQMMGRLKNYEYDNDIPVFPLIGTDRIHINPEINGKTFNKYLKLAFEKINSGTLGLHADADESYELATTEEDLEKWFAPVIDNLHEPLSWDCETSSLSTFKPGFYTGLISFDHPANDTPLIFVTDYPKAEQIYKKQHPNAKASWQKARAGNLGFMKQIMESPKVKKIGHNLQYDENCVWSSYKWKVKGFHADTMLLNFILYPDEKGQNKLDDLIAKWLPETPRYWEKFYKIKEAIMKEKPDMTYMDIPQKDLFPYAAYDTKTVSQIYKIFMKQLDDRAEQGMGGYHVVNIEDQETLPTYTMKEYAIHGRSVHHKLCTHLEQVGQNVDYDIVEYIEKRYIKERDDINNELAEDPDLVCFETHVLGEVTGKTTQQRKMYMNGEKPNINWASQPQQVEFFINFLQMPVLKKTDKGNPSLDEAVIADYANLHNCSSARLLGKWKKADKFITSFVSPILTTDPKKSIVHGDKMIHCAFGSGHTVTGRLNARKPNMQALPRGGLIKKLYNSRHKGGWVMTRDYSGLEVRVLTIESRDQQLIDIYLSGGDVHFLTQQHFFKDLADKNNKNQRTICKRALFGKVYGQGDMGLFEMLTDEGVVSPMTGEPITLDECRIFNQMLADAYPGVAEYIDLMHAQAAMYKYVCTPFGFVRDLPGMENNKYYEELKATMSWEEQRESYRMRVLGAEVSAAKRLSVNSPIQGSASDITVFAAWRIKQQMEKAGLDSIMYNIVHDDIWIDIPCSDEVPEVSRIMRDTMDNVPEWINELLPNFNSDWMKIIPIIGEGELGVNTKDAYGLSVEPSKYAGIPNEDLAMAIPKGVAEDILGKEIEDEYINMKFSEYGEEVRDQLMLQKFNFA